MKPRSVLVSFPFQVLVRINGLFIQLPGQRMPALSLVEWRGPTRIQSPHIFSCQ